MNDIRELLEGEAARIEPSPDGLERTLERVRPTWPSRRMARFVAVAASVVLFGGGLAWAIASLAGLGRDGVAPVESQPNYRFEIVDIRVDEGDPSIAIVKQRLFWSMDQFPGTHRCTWRVFGPDGSPIGQRIDELTSLSGDGTLSTQRVKVAGMPATATATCDPQRLDVGEPYYAYEFRGLRVVVQPTLALRFTAVWLGPAHPGTVFYTATVRRASGELVASTQFTLASGVRVTGENDFFFAPETIIEDVSADDADDLMGSLDCRPFTGEERTEPAPSPSAPVEITPPPLPTELQPLASAVWQVMMEKVAAGYTGGWYLHDGELVLQLEWDKEQEAFEVHVDVSQRTIERLTGDVPPELADAASIVGTELDVSSIPTRPHHRFVRITVVDDPKDPGFGVQFYMFWIGPLGSGGSERCTVSVYDESGGISAEREVDVPEPYLEGARDRMASVEFPGLPPKGATASVICGA